MAKIDEQLRSAVAYHQAGRLEEAERSYRQVLAADPRCASAWHGLGAIAYVAGQPEQACEYFQRSLEFEPNDSGALNNLGLAYQAEGKLEEAADCYQRSIEFRPKFAEALFNLGNVFRERCALDEAATYYRRALQIDPTSAAAWTNLGAVLREQQNLDEAGSCFSRALEFEPNDSDVLYNLGLVRQDEGQMDEAIALYRRALALDRSNSEAHCNLGVLLKDQGKLNEAVESFRRAIELKSDLADAHSGLGKALHGLGKREEAACCFRRAIELRPADADFNNNLGVVLQDQGFAPESVKCFRQALANRPSFAEAQFNLGRALYELGQFDEARKLFRTALEIRPDMHQPHWGLSLLMLLHGDFSNGWEEYESRWKSEQLIPRHFGPPRWNGEPLTGKTILLHAEQGVGDTINFIRYAGMVNRLGATVVVECPRALMKLLATCPGIDALVARGGDLPPFDFHSPLMSLPRVFRTDLATIPSCIPYLSAADELVVLWRKKLQAVHGLRVAINWRCEPGKLDSARRTIPLGMFAPLAQINGVRLISVHKGEGQAELAVERDSLPIVDIGKDFDTMHGAFMDTAAIMKNVDLLISADTSTAHLAGALGIPVWLALPHVHDWRWLLDRDDSPWYPTMRLFRQKTRGDWEEVFVEIKSALLERLSSSR
ncbi:MAG TPA: tetratricopeptide repeat protein [Pirellulaceae bacterium]|jgi:tetratricopeptide (TPR) repeat protein